MATNVYSLVPSWNVGGQFAANVLHYQFDDGAFNSTFAAAKALTDAWVATAYPAMANMMPDSVIALTVKAKRVSVVGGFEAVNVSLSGNTGNRTGNMKISGIGPVIVLYEISNGKRRGRVFIPGATDTDLVNGVWTDAFRTAVVASIPTFIGDLVLTGGGAPTAKMVIYHPQTHVGFLLSAGNLSMTVGTMKRRQLPA